MNTNENFPVYVTKGDVSGKNNGGFSAVRVNTPSDVRLMLQLLKIPDTPPNLSLMCYSISTFSRMSFTYAKPDGSTVVVNNEINYGNWVVRDNKQQAFAVYSDEEFNNSFELYDRKKAIQHFEEIIESAVTAIHSYVTDNSSIAEEATSTVEQQLSQEGKEEMSVYTRNTAKNLYEKALDEYQNLPEPSFIDSWIENDLYPVMVASGAVKGQSMVFKTRDTFPMIKRYKTDNKAYKDVVGFFAGLERRGFELSYNFETLDQPDSVFHVWVKADDMKADEGEEVLLNG